MIVQVGDSPMDVNHIILMRNRDAVLEGMARGEVNKATTICLPLHNPEQAKEAATMNASGWDILCFVLPGGRAKYMIKNPDHLSIAEQIGQEVNAEVLRSNASETDVQ